MRGEGETQKQSIMDTETVGLHMLEEEFNSKHIHMCATFGRNLNSNSNLI